MNSLESVEVIHVTEALGGGVLEVIRLIANGSARRGCATTVVFARRPDTPPTEILQRIFEPTIELIEVGSGGKAISAWRLGRAIQRISTTRPRAVIHAHSSVAGFASRVAGAVSGVGGRILYSPHGFAFLKMDSSSATRFGYFMAERILARLCRGIVVVSESEGLEAQRLRARRIDVVANGVERPDLDRNKSIPKRRPLVGCVGRIAPQKAPEQFQYVASSLEGLADFVWVGGDPSSDDLSPATVVPWLSREKLAEQVADFDVFLLMSRWEGMPLALIEAQMLGVPGVATDVVGNRDVILDGITGYLVADVAGAVDRVRAILSSSALHDRLSTASIRESVRFEAERMVGEYITLYREGSFEHATV